MEKPTLPKGTRDFGPSSMAKRQFIFNGIRSVFQKFGFLPLETPAMENLSTLTGKYGEEGDQLLFKVLDSGDYIEKAKNNILSKRQLMEITEWFISVFNLVISDSNQVPQGNYLDGIYLKFREELRTSNVFFPGGNTFVAHITSIKSQEIFYIIVQSQPNFRQAPYSNSFPLQQINKTEELESNISRVIQDWLLFRSSSKELIRFISEKGLRYDLTVPFARYVVMNRHEIVLPFKRYQIQPVWRADRPQRGRYREFYQCDADVVGTNSLVCEAEVILMIKEVFAKLNITDYAIKINHRGVLAGMAEVLNVKGKETELYTAIDKLDKIGEKGVRDELVSKGFDDAALNKLFELLHTSGSNIQKSDSLKKIFQHTEQGTKGVADLQEVLALLGHYGNNDEHVEVDVALARGLSYYTGTIFEVKINKVAIGSVSGGGRYDNLTQAFGAKEPLPGIGISFGVDRIYDAMEELNLFPKEAQLSSRVLICHLDETCMQFGFKILSQLRDADIAAEIYPDESKLKKQLDYGNKKNIPFTLVIGSEEIKSGELVIKNMEAGEQEKLSLDKIIHKLKAN